ncbi:MAG TPA: hypothetical protein VLE95_04435 [Chlamydiales bacterium]|nr:hypothetical protein [Chlamydiales bacterium]
MTHRSWILLSGFLWMAIGSFLLYKGLHFIADGTLRTDSLCFRLQGLFGGVQQAGAGLIGVGLLVGFIKGRFVLSKTVKKIALRIQSFSQPIRVTSIYGPSYWILIAGMIGFGILLRFLPIPIDLRGVIDTAVGSALIHGAMLYFRTARTISS